jgi:putative tricarboxylic transport membrane protein
MLDRYRWLDRYLAGDAFADFAAAEEERVRDILRELGTGRDGAESLSEVGAYPLFVLGGLALFGIAAVVHPSTRRSGRIELDSTKWRPIALIGVGAALNLVLAERAGFVIASAVLFWLVARAFDARRPLRDAAAAIAVSFAAYLLFARVLQLPLPAGVLARWL